MFSQYQEVVLSLITGMINRNTEFSLLLLRHDLPQNVLGHLILKRVVVHYACGARELSGLESSDNEATVTGLNPWKGQIIQ